MAGEKTRRELMFLLGPEDLATPEQREGFADGIADFVVDAVNAELARQGKPPLAEAEPKKWTTDEIIEDPEGWYVAMLPEWRSNSPHMTEPEIRANFEAARAILGF
jgi:hypothetical protein